MALHSWSEQKRVSMPKMIINGNQKSATSEALKGS